MSNHRRFGDIALVIATALAVAACADDDIDGFHEGEWATISSLSPLPAPPPDPSNKFADDPGAAALGQMLFFDPSYSGPILIGDDGQNGGLGPAGTPGLVACASCHLGPWMIDTRSQPGHISLGSGYVPRNATSMVNAAYYVPWSENDGVRDSHWSKNMIDLEADIGANTTRLALAHFMYETYRAEYDAVFDQALPTALDPADPDAARFPLAGKPGTPEWDGMTPADQALVTRIYVNYGKALQAYERMLISKNARFDRYVGQNFDQLDPAEKRGLGLFIGKAGCVRCHSGPAFTDNQFHNLGMVWMGENITEDWEQGRFGGIEFLLADDHEFRADSEWSDDPENGAARLATVPADRVDGTLVVDETTRGQWRTKSLRHVAETAPYMHNGQFATLREVVEFYNRGGDDAGYIGDKSPLMTPLDMSDDEIDDVVAFLGTLTGEEIPVELRTDTSR